MIKYFIEGQEIILPEDFSITVTEENAQLTENGEWTLDITVSLMNDVNAKVFKHLSRLNNEVIPESWASVLHYNNKSRNGKSIFLKNTDTTITFSFVAGNSELNYLIKNDTKIWGLDWGTETAIDFNRAKNSLNLVGYGNGGENFICTPVKVSDIIVNNYNIDMTAIDGEIVMQPYLLYYINKLPELLGYTMHLNILNDDPMIKDLFIVNSINSLNYADLLPDVTISEFIEYVQNFFNVFFDVDSINKSISIVRLQEDIINKRVIHVENVLDEYTRDRTENEIKSNRFNFLKIDYDVPGSNYFKYTKLSDDILSMCQIIDVDINTFWPEDSEANKLKIYRDISSKDHYYFRLAPWSGGISPNTAINSIGKGGSNMFRDMIDIFSGVGENDGNTLTLKISPSAIAYNSFTIQDGQGTSSTGVQMPESGNDYFKAEDIDIINLIEGGESPINRPDRIEVSFYWGLIDIVRSVTLNPYTRHFTTYPMSYNDKATTIDGYSKVPSWTLKIKGPTGIFKRFSFENKIDSSAVYIFDIKDSPDIRIDNIFYINGAKYLPIRFERIIKTTNNSIVKGEFCKLLD